MRYRPLFIVALATLAAATLSWAPISNGGAEASAASVDRLAKAQASKLADAKQAFREGRYPAAYGRFAALADAGHAPSAEISLVMWRHGRDLFGSEWSATPVQLRRWTAVTVDRARTGTGWAEEAGQGSE
ncbi:MAG: hypothetical protein JNN03_07685 [Rubrivivax sp.]|nr:hypothetical protein [Rubrivivax sp.]